MPQQTLPARKQARVSEVHQQRQFAQAALSRALRDLGCLVGNECTSPDTALLRLQLQLASAILGKRLHSEKNPGGLLSTKDVGARNREQKQHLEALLESIEGL